MNKNTMHLFSGSLSFSLSGFLEYIFRCLPIGILVDTESCHLGYFQNRKRCKSVSSVYCCSPQLSCNTGVQMDNNIYKSCNRRFHRYDLPLVCSRLVRSSYICNRRCTLSFPMASSCCGDQSACWSFEVSSTILTIYPIIFSLIVNLPAIMTYVAASVFFFGVIPL